MDKFYEVEDGTKEIFLEVFNKKAFPVNVSFQYLGSSKQKQLIKIAKLPDQYAFLLQKDILVTINEDLLSKFDDELITILIEQEIDKISINSQSGAIKMVRPDLSTFSSIIIRYGVEKVARANEVEELYHQQTKDGTAEELSF